MQKDDLDILGAFTSLIRTVKETDKLSSKPLEQWPTYSSIISKITEENEEFMYQAQPLKKLPEAKSHYESVYKSFCS